MRLFEEKTDLPTGNVDKQLEYVIERAEFAPETGLYSFYVFLQDIGSLKIVTDGKDTTHVFKCISKNWFHINKTICTKPMLQLAKWIESDVHHAYSVAKPLNY